MLKSFGGFIFYKYHFMLPLHCTSVQISYAALSPKQAFPPCDGHGLSQDRSLRLRPTPQFGKHKPHRLQRLQPPCTVLRYFCQYDIVGPIDEMWSFRKMAFKKCIPYYMVLKIKISSLQKKPFKCNLVSIV